VRERLATRLTLDRWQQTLFAKLPDFGVTCPQSCSVLVRNDAEQEFRLSVQRHVLYPAVAISLTVGEQALREKLFQLRQALHVQAPQMGLTDERLGHGTAQVRSGSGRERKRLESRFCRRTKGRCERSPTKADVAEFVRASLNAPLH